jgi:nitroimidazol reductase NimA-like FMN-containing flavoprotein (pyridoxamine 5'-phosphate oxidase superfamily)
MYLSELKDKIESYLKDHDYMTVATAAPDATPRAATVSYATEGMTIYFSTGPSTEKYKNIASKPAVACTVDEDEKDWSKIKGVQLTGFATIVEDEEEQSAAFDLLQSKFPQMKEMPPKVRPKIIRIDPKAAYFIDNSLSFGHRDKAEF